MNYECPCETIFILYFSEQEETPKNKEETVERELSHLKTIFLSKS